MFNFLKRYKWPILISFSGILFITGIVYSKNLTSPKTSGLSKFTVTPTDLEETLALSAEVKAEEKTNLRFQTSGRLNWVGVKVGDVVKKYQALAALDVRDVRKNLEKDLNDYLSERWDFEQTKDDNKNKIRTDTIKRILEKSQFNLNNAVLNVELRNLSLEYATLISPIPGIVTSMNTPVAGVNITPATSEIEVVNPASLYLSVLPDQTEVTKLTPGMTATLHLDSYPDATLSGTVKNIAFKPESGETSTVYEVKVILNESNLQNLRLGMTGDALFTTKKLNNVIAIPNKFIKNDQGKPYVRKEIGGKPQKTWIETGDEIDDLTVVISGLNSDDVIHD